MATRIALITLTALAACTNAAAQGFFDFGEIPGVDEPTVEVDLTAPLLNFVAEAAREGDPLAADVISGLEGIRVRVYDTLQDPTAVAAFVDDASDALERGGWQRMVYVQDGRDKVRIYTRLEGQVVSGMTVLIVDATEAVFINIAGSINPMQLGRVASAMGFSGFLGPYNGNGEAPRGQPADSAD